MEGNARIVCPFSARTRYQAGLPGVEEAMALIAGLKTCGTAAYPISSGRVMVSAGMTMPTENAIFEAHRQYLDRPNDYYKIVVK